MPQPEPPAPPLQPVLLDITCVSAIAHWQLGGFSDTDCGKGRDSPSRPGREPGGGGEEDASMEDAVACPDVSSIVLVAENGEEIASIEGAWNAALFGNAGGFEATIALLQPGASYAAKARIVSPHFGNVDSAAVPFTACAAAPARPDKPVVSGKGKNFLKLRWTAPDSHGAAVAQYELELRDANNFPDATEETGAPEPWGHGVQVHQGPETRCEIKGLRPGSSVQCRVRAFNAIGASPPSRWLLVNLTATVPSAPPRPFLAQASLGELVFGWDASGDTGGSEIESYCLELDAGSDDGFLVKYNGPDRQWRLSKTTPGQPYKVRVKACNAAGASPFSEELTVEGLCAPPSPPGAPEKMEVPPGTPTPGPAFSLCVRWAAPSEDNGAVVDGYQAMMRRLVDGVPVEYFHPAYAGRDAWCQVSGLCPAAQYEVGIVAVSRLGASMPSTTSILSTSGCPPCAPPPPFLLSVDGPDVEVGWALPHVCNGSPVSRFILESSVQASRHATSDIASPDDQGISGPSGWMSRVQYEGGGLSHRLSGLEPGAPVWLRVAGINAYGQGPWSNPWCMDMPCVLPGRVSNVSASPTGPGRGCVCWDAPAKDGGCPVSAYKVFVTRKGGGGGGEPIVVVVDAPGAVVEGLRAGSIYSAKVQAINAVGAGDWSEPCVFSSEAGAPSAPPPPHVSHVATDCIGLSWEKPSHSHGADVDAFTLEMQEDSGWRAIYNGSLLSFQVGGLEPGTSYHFRVRGRNAAGDGPFSAAVQAFTDAVPPGPPLSVSVVSVSAREAKLKWLPPAFSGGSDITSYSVFLQVGGEKGLAGDGGGSEGREVYRGVLNSCKFKVAPDCVYSCQVYAYTVVGHGAPSMVLSFSTPAAPAATVRARAPPVMPSPTVKVKGAGLHVSWAPCRDAQPAVDLYHVSIAPEGLEEDAAEEMTLCYSGPATSTDVRNVAVGVTYHVRVCAENEVGQGPWSPIAVFFPKTSEKKTALRAHPVPAPPTDLFLEKATRTSLRISWEAGGKLQKSSAPGAKACRRAAAHENGAESFNVEVQEVADGASGTWSVAGEGLTSTDLRLTKLKAGTTYRVRVCRVTQKRGISAWSEEACFSTDTGADDEAMMGYLFMIAMFLFLINVVLTPSVP